MWFLVILNILCVVSFSQEIPKETYLTFDEFLSERTMSNKQLKSIPSNWINLKYKKPLIGKFKVNDNTVVSISKFTGSIGNELSNYNRWRSQLNLDPVETFSDIMVSRSNDGDLQKNQYLLNNDTTFYLIVWLTYNNTHFFIKVSSQEMIDEPLISTFIGAQSWKSI